ncbi:MAG: ABC transporter ATP-binding protein [Vulcanimicrobiota bacterium]
MSPLLEVEGLSVTFRSGGLLRPTRELRAVDDVSLWLEPGETLGLVGESGSGKSTTARAILRLVPASGGTVHFAGQPVFALRGQDLRAFRRRAQFVFQDPYSSLNPRQTIGSILAEPLVIHGLARGPELSARVDELMAKVGLSPDMKSRYPHQFSGGQRQRIGIARALASGPELVVADEPVSALDVSIQAQVLNLLSQLQQEYGLAVLMISHDLAVIRQICHRVAVMFLGRIVEMGPVEQVCRSPRHPYTRALLDAVPSFSGFQVNAQASAPVDRRQPGCRYAPRCPLATEVCRQEIPPLAEKLPGRVVACHHLPEES